jgi:hypothetical protein
VVETRTRSGVNDFLYFVVAHEFGHILDFANRLNSFAACDEATGPCASEAGSWSALSWQTTAQPIEADRFPYRRGLCFYACEGEAMTAAAVEQEYEGLARSGFISNYAATNPFDDFADSLAYYLMDRELATSYVIDTRQGRSYDVIAKLTSPLFAAKRRYIQDFLERTDIVYP